MNGIVEEIGKLKAEREGCMKQIAHIDQVLAEIGAAVSGDVPVASPKTPRKRVRKPRVTLIQGEALTPKG